MKVESIERDVLSPLDGLHHSTTVVCGSANKRAELARALTARNESVTWVRTSDDAPITLAESACIITKQTPLRMFAGHDLLPADARQPRTRWVVISDAQVYHRSELERLKIHCRNFGGHVIFLVPTSGPLRAEGVTEARSENSPAGAVTCP